MCAMIIVALNAKLVYEEIIGWINTSPSTALWMYILVLPCVMAIFFLLLYVFLRPLLFKHKDAAVYVPHGIASAINDLDTIHYKHIAISIDFSKNDTDSIRHAI